MPELTALDKKILCILVEDGRVSAAEIAEKLSTPASTIRNRIQRLEHLGVITGYRAVVNRLKLGFGLKAVIEVQREATRNYDDFLVELRKVEEAVEVIVPTGLTDALVTVWVKDVEHLRRLLQERLNLLPGVVRNNTLISLMEETYPPPISLADRIVDTDAED